MYFGIFGSTFKPIYKVMNSVALKVELNQSTYTSILVLSLVYSTNSYIDGKLHKGGGNKCTDSKDAT